MNAPSLGSPRFASPYSHWVDDQVRIPERIEVNAKQDVTFELAGPRAQLYFDPTRTCAGIVTCGGLCPGLNNVIRSLYFELSHGYRVPRVWGFRGGYRGLDPARSAPPIELTPSFVDDIHHQGGTILGTSRGPVDVKVAVDHLMHLGVNILFTVGGDGTQRGAKAFYDEASKRGYDLAVVGVPKTIDNDVSFVSRTFGYLTAVEEACRVLDCAHTEARSVTNGISLVKLMGRHAGYITAGATVANQDVNFALIPEVPFTLPGFLAALHERIDRRAHAVIAVAEGAGQELIPDAPEERDASGHAKLKDIGLFLKTAIETYFRERNVPIVMRYFDPSYQIRSRPANCEDSLLCDLYARYAVHAAMAGKTGIVIGFLHERFIHAPIDLLAGRTKQLDPNSGWWRSVLSTTRQPAQF